MPLKLTFVSTGNRLIGDSTPDASVSGETATDVLNEWNKLPWFAYLGPEEFRAHVLRAHGADDPERVSTPVSADAGDERVLDAVVMAAGPQVLKLDRSSGFADRIKRAIGQVA
jgi:hypothetical protein